MPFPILGASILLVGTKDTQYKQSGSMLEWQGRHKTSWFQRKKKSEKWIEPPLQR